MVPPKLNGKWKWRHLICGISQNFKNQWMFLFLPITSYILSKYLNFISWFSPFKIVKHNSPSHSDAKNVSDMDCYWFTKIKRLYVDPDPEKIIEKYRTCHICTSQFMRWEVSGVCRAGGYKEMSSIFADQWRTRIRVPMRGDWEGLQGLSQWVQLCTWSPNKLWISTSIFIL